MLRKSFDVSEVTMTFRSGRRGGSRFRNPNKINVRESAHGLHVMMRVIVGIPGKDLSGLSASQVPSVITFTGFRGAV